MNEYKLKDTVWIHIGEPRLTEGRVVHIITLDHLNENHPVGRKLYVIEVHTGIDDIYEVRDWESISTDAKGPINLFRNLGTATRKLAKLGIKTTRADVESTDDEDDPTADQINEALHRTEQSTKHSAMSPKPATKAKRRPYKKPKA